MSVVVMVDLNIFNPCYVVFTKKCHAVYWGRSPCNTESSNMFKKGRQGIEGLGGQAQYNVMVSQTILILLQSNIQCCAARNRQVACKAYLISLWSSTMWYWSSTMGADFAFDKLSAPTCSTCANAGSSASNILFMLPDIECMAKGIWYVSSTHKLQNQPKTLKLVCDISI